MEVSTPRGPRLAHRLGLVLFVMLVVTALAACQGRGETAQSTAAATPAPTIAPVPTVAMPGLPQPGQTGATSGSGSLANRAYTGEIRAKQQVSLSPKVGGRIQEIKVDVGDRVKAGDVIAVLEKSTQEAQLAQAKAQLAAAQANLANIQAPPREADLAAAQAGIRAAQAGLDRLRQSVRPADIAAAQAGLKAAQAGLERVKTGAQPEDREQARLRIEQAKNQLLSLQGQRDAVCGTAAALRDSNPPSQAKDAVKTQAAQATGQCDSFRGQVQAAEAAVQIAEQAYQRIENGATDQDLTQAQAAVDQASANLQRLNQGPTQAELNQAQAAIDQANASLRRLQAGPSDEQVKAVEAQVNVAQAAVDLAQLNVDDMTLKAPFDGVISARNATVGTSVSGGGGGGGGTSSGVVTLISDATEVAFDVDSALIAQIKVGDPIEVTVDTYADSVFKGKVTRIAPTADPTTRTFKVYAEPTDPDRKLRPGMYTTVTLLGGK